MTTSNLQLENALISLLMFVKTSGITTAVARAQTGVISEMLKNAGLKESADILDGLQIEAVAAYQQEQTLTSFVGGDLDAAEDGLLSDYGFRMFNSLIDSLYGRVSEDLDVYLQNNFL